MFRIVSQPQSQNTDLQFIVGKKNFQLFNLTVFYKQQE